MAGYRLHGVALAAGRVERDPVEALLRPFRDDGAERAPDLVVALVPAPPRRPGAGGRELFRQGDVVVRGEPGAATLAVESPRAALAVRTDGSRIDGTFLPPADDDALDALAHVELFVALAVALRPRGLFHLHAAATIAPSGEPVLVAGTGGAGKSTLATALVAAGHAFLGDDVAFVARRGGAPRLLGFPRAFHLSDGSARAVPATLPHVSAAGRTLAGKRRVDARAAFPGAARAEAGAPALLLFPEVVDAEATRAEPLLAAEALGGLLASSLFATTALGSGAQRALLAELAGSARSYRVLLGRDLLSDAVGTAARLSAALTATPSR